MIHMNNIILASADLAGTVIEFLELFRSYTKGVAYPVMGSTKPLRVYRYRAPRDITHCPVPLKGLEIRGVRDTSLVLLIVGPAEPV